MTPHDHPAPVPPGFAPLQRGGPYIAALGPLYYRRDGNDTVIAIRVEERHTNMRGIAHGGMLASLADSALGIGISMACDGKTSFVTVNLTTDFVEAARPGDWVEAHLDIQRIGQRMAFANCYLQVGEKRILRASGVFAAMKPLTEAQLNSGY
ncbi:MAG TPA: PaaI family thioesterase [Telluria sp.]